MPPDCYSPAPVPKADITVVRVTCWGFFFGIIQYADCRRAGPAQPPPFPQIHAAWRNTPAFSHILSSVLLCTLWGSAPIKWCPQGMMFPLSSFLPNTEFGHIWECLFTSYIYWNHRKSVHRSQWAVDFAVLWKTATRLWGWIFWEVPTSAFRYKASIIISPGAIPHSDGNFCLPALTRSLNLCKTYPVYQMRSPFWELFLLCCHCTQQLHEHWLSFPSPMERAVVIIIGFSC